ncbi:MAG: hypothetical protein KDA32_12570 [Phycisphaerales bacterium]|nr:hypothetical protein [Phycisphaerales bacterium]
MKNAIYCPLWVAALGIAFLAACGRQDETGPLFSGVISGTTPISLPDTSAIKPPDQYQPAAYEKIELNLGADYAPAAVEEPAGEAAATGEEPTAIRESLTQLANDFQQFSAEGVLGALIPEQVAPLNAKLDAIQPLFTSLGNLSRAAEQKVGSEASGDPAAMLKSALDALDIEVADADQATVRLNGGRFFSSLPADAIAQMEAQGMSREMFEAQLSVVPPLPMKLVDGRWRFELPMTIDEAMVEGVLEVLPNVQAVFDRYTQQINEVETMSQQDLMAMMQQMQFELIGVLSSVGQAPEQPTGGRFGGP